MSIQKVTLALSAFGILASSFIPSSAYANLEKQAVYETIKAYANLTACNHSFDQNAIDIKTTTQDIFFIDTEFNEDMDATKTTYYVLWYGDMACQGARLSSRYYVTEVVKQPYRLDRFLVMDNHAAFGDEGELISYNYIDSVRQLSDDRFVIDAWEYNAQQDNYNKYRHTITKRYYDNGHWDGYSWQLSGKKWLERQENMMLVQ